MADERPSRARNLSYTVMAGQSGCASVVIIFVALFIGLWLDNQFGQRGPFTICLLILSIPLSLFIMLRIALQTISMIRPPEKPTEAATHVEEDDL